MSNSLRNVLYLGDNIILVDALLNSLAAEQQPDNSRVFHLRSTEQLYQTLSENNVSHFISEFPVKSALKDKIKADFPLLNTTYLNTGEKPKQTELSVDIENIFIDEVKVVLECLSIPVYFKNKQGQYLACNRHFSKLFGLIPEQVVGKKLADISGSPLTDDIDEIDKKMLVDQQVALHEYAWTNKAGEERNILFHKEWAPDGNMQIGLIFDTTELNKSKYLLEKEHVMLRATVDTCQDIIFFRDLDGLLLGCNRQFEEFVGCLEKDLLGKKARDFFPLAQAVMSAEQYQYIIKNNKVYIGEELFTAHNGENHFFNIKKVPLQDKHGNAQGVVTIGRNMTEQLIIQKRLEIANVVFENSKESLIVTDGSGKIISANDRACFIFGYSKEQLLAQDINLLASEPHNDTFYKNIEQTLKTDSSWQGDITYRNKSGNVYYAWLEVYAVEHAYENTVDRVYSYTDLTHFQAIDKKISFLSKQDPLTGLRNRISLFSRLEDIITRANYQHSAVAVLLVDIDSFKTINDQYGHNTGDKVLQEVAQRLKNCISEKDTLGRFANDQFIIIIDELANEHCAAMVAQKITAQFNSPFIIENMHANFSAKIGISLYPDDGADVDTLFFNAEKAMQRGKRDKSAAYNFYTNDLMLGLNQQLALEEELKQALLLEQFDLYYQPQYDLNKGKIVALESLLRWHHPRHGLLLPEYFLSLAEESGLLVPIGLKMIRKAALQAVTWEKKNIQFSRIAINLSKIQLSQISFIADMLTILKETSCQSQWLEFEVNETIFNGDSIVIYDNLTNLGKLGFSLTIDGFGIERSVLDSIDHLPIGKFKIPQHFIQRVPGHRADEGIIKSMFVLAGYLDIDVVGVGIENTQQEAFLNLHHIDLGQGNFRAKAMTVAETTFYLRCNKKK